jgi:hypothetical protein
MNSIKRFINSGVTPLSILPLISQTLNDGISTFLLQFVNIRFKSGKQQKSKLL